MCGGSLVLMSHALVQLAFLGGRALLPSRCSGLLLELFLASFGSRFSRSSLLVRGGSLVLLLGRAPLCLLLA